MDHQEAIARIREALIADPSNAFKSDPSYAIRDPELLDPVIERVIVRSFRGEAPTDEAGIERVARRCRGASRSLIGTDEGRAEVEGHLAHRYAHPLIGWEDKLLVADHGLTPGPLVRRLRAGWDVVESEVVEAGEWRGDEVARSLMARHASWPDAPVIALRIRVPEGTVQTGWEYRWIRPQDRIAVTKATRSTFVWVTDALNDDLGPLLRGELSLRTQDLRRTSLTRKAFGWDPGAPI